MLCLPLIRMLRSLRLSARAATSGALALGMLLASAATAPAAPDLVAEKITLNPKMAILGVTTFTMRLTIHNTGTTAAGAQITRIWASKDSQINGAGNDVLLFTLPVPALAAGQSVTFTSTTTPKVVIDPNRVGPAGTDYLPKNTYFIGVEVDAFNQVPGESNENNFFKSSDTLYVTVRQPVGPISYLPGTSTDNVSVIRTLQWTTVTNANRYDVFLARLKDTTQQFYPHALLNITTPAQAVVLTDMKGAYEPYTDPGLNALKRPNNTPDILIAQNNQLSLYNRVYDDYVGNPRYWKPFTLFKGDFTTQVTYAYTASRKFAPGIISAVTAANMNFAYTADRGDGWSSHDCMDAVFALYGTARRIGTTDPPRYSTSLLGQVYVVMNKLDFYFWGGGGKGWFPTTDTITSTSDFMLMPLPNYRGPKVPGDNCTPYGIKSLVVADFDHDGDLDIMAGADRYPYYDDDKIVVWQSDYHNSPNGDNDPWPYDYPVFTPRNFPSMNSTLEDLQDMAVIDVDRDNMPDVVCASYHSDRLWLLYNKTKDGSGRSTRTLDFDIVGPLPTDDAMTTSVFRGANTVCVRDLNNDRLADIIAGAYFDGKIVVYENQSMGPGGVTLAELVPHVLATGLPNLEKVTTADVNGDGLYDILASSATNDLIVWYENQGNFQFLAHTVTQNANRVGSIVVNDMNNDQMPDIVSYSQYDKSLTWYASWPTLTSANLVGSNLIQPRYKPNKPMDFNTTYIWKVVSKAADVYSTNSDILTFRTQPTRINIDPINIPVNPMEPNAGLALELNTLVDGPQQIWDFGIRTYADPILDRGFLMANAPATLPAPLNPMNLIGPYEFTTSYAAGQRAFLTPKYDYTTMPEGLYNLYTVATGSTPDIHDGVRNGVFDGIPDGVDNGYPFTMSQAFSNPTYGDDAYLAGEKLAVIRKPGLPLSPTPRDNAINVPTGVQLGWTSSTYATSYDVYMAGAASTLPQYTSITVTSALPNMQSIATGDLNNDGMPDVAASHVAGLNDARIYWMDSRSGGRGFGRNWVASGLLGAPLLKVADMDLDGKADILAGSSADGQIWWYRNKGGNPVVFDAPTIVGRNVTSLNSIQAVDMDGDRDIDVLVASSVGNRLYYYERAGSSYILRTIDASQGQALYARAADVDQDGDMDVVAAFWSPNSVAWYENKGGTPPTFVRHVLSTAINSPRWLAIGDLDGDSDLDIAVDSQVEGKIYQFLNNGAALPAFATSVAAQGLLGPHGLEIVDFNHDCRADLVTATATGNRLLYLMNSGGTPPAYIQYPIWTYPVPVADVATGDMDKDNFGEVLGATSSGTINWFDYVVNYNFPMALTLQNATGLPINAYKPATLSPAMGYRWQVLAKRTIPIYGGTLERVTSSSLWTFFTGQSDLVAKDVTYTPAAVVQGDNVKFTVTETNSGFSDSAIHLAEIWASPDSIITRGGNDILLKRVYMGVVPAQGTVSIPSTVSTGALQEGNYYIGLFVDPTNQDKSESSKDNNKLVKLTPRLQILHRNNVGNWTNYR